MIESPNRLQKSGPCNAGPSCRCTRKGVAAGRYQWDPPKASQSHQLLGDTRSESSFQVRVEHREGAVRRLQTIVAAIVVAACWSIPAIAQQQARAAVYVQSSAEDPVGRLLAFEVREAVRRSSGLLLADRQADARFILRLVTLDPDRERSPGISTVYSAVYTMWTLHDAPVEMYLDSSVGTCGSSRVESCGRRMAATLDENASEFRAVIRNMLESAESKK